MGLVHRLENRLAQALLPLGGEEQSLHEFPGGRLFATQQRARNVSAHAADLVLAAGRVAEDFKDALPGFPSLINRSRQQITQQERGIEVDRPGGDPFDADGILGEFIQGVDHPEQILLSPLGRGLGKMRRPKRPALVAIGVRQPIKQAPARLDLPGQRRKESLHHLGAGFRLRVQHPPGAFPDPADLMIVDRQRPAIGLPVDEVHCHLADGGRKFFDTVQAGFKMLGRPEFRELLAGIDGIQHGSAPRQHGQTDERDPAFRSHPHPLID